MKKTILVTGCVGFIGFHACMKFLKKKFNVIGIDNINNYYDKEIKYSRLKILKKNSNFKFYKIDISNSDSLKRVFKNKIDIVINLAAQAGVRYSFINRNAYFDSNLLGFYNVVELSSFYKIKRFIFASTSSVYGDTKKFPLKENDLTDKPISFYAATKKCNEVIAYSYSKFTKTKFIGLRFFTAYGPLGRPDMSLFKFTKAILNSKVVEIYNRGNHSRDFTYIDDIVEGIYMSSIKKINSNYEIFNIGRGKNEKLLDFLKEIEKNTKTKYSRKMLPLQRGDIVKTSASIAKAKKLLNYNPKIKIKSGVYKFVKWFKKYYDK